MCLMLCGGSRFPVIPMFVSTKALLAASFAVASSVAQTIHGNRESNFPLFFLVLKIPSKVFLFVPGLGACGYTNSSDQIVASVPSKIYSSYP